jgi:hypothetical protein
MNEQAERRSDRGRPENDAGRQLSVPIIGQIRSAGDRLFEWWH